MSLEKIKEKLYKKEEEKNLSKHEESFYDPHVASLSSELNSTGTDLWAQKQKGLGEVEKKAITKGVWFLVGLVVFLLVVGGVYFVRKSAFSDDRVVLAIVGLDRIDSGEYLAYEISYKNDNRADLNNAVLKVSYPEDFKSEGNTRFSQDTPISSTINLGTIKGHSEGKTAFNGRIYSPKGALMYLKAELKYSPSGFSSQYTANKQLAISIDTSPLKIEVLAPQNVASGDEVNYLISYVNEGEREMHDLRIKMEYPEGFTFGNSDPKSFEGNNIWYVGNLSPKQSGKIVVSGKLEGERDITKTAKVQIGTSEGGTFISYNDEETNTKIVASPMFISQAVNEVKNPNINAGETLGFSIYYRNDGSTALRDVIVTEKIDSPILEYGLLDARGGAFDSDSKTITWKASDHPGLKNVGPGQDGSILFSIKIKDVIPMASANDKNYVVSSLVKIDSPDIPTPISMNKIVAGNRLDMKLNSKLILVVQGFHQDSNIQNSGPIPPKVDQETTYVMHWKVSNVSNDISNATVESVLPTEVAMTGKIYPEDAHVTYNERNNSIIWEIGNMAAGDGILNAPKEVSFQIKIKPSPNQIGSEPKLLGTSIFKGKDLFTGQELSFSADGKFTRLFEDTSLHGPQEVSR